MEAPNREAIVAIRETAGDASNNFQFPSEDKAYLEGAHDALSWVLGECKVVLTDSELFFTYDLEKEE